MRGKHLERKTNRWGGRGRDARVGLRTGRKEAAEAGVGQPARGSSGEVPGRPWKSPSTLSTALRTRRLLRPQAPLVWVPRRKWVIRSPRAQHWVLAQDRGALEVR